jgi:glycosyltransferase involved in cell wall biosynthesis
MQPERQTRAWEISPVLGLDAPPAPASGLRVAVVHDYLTQRGGAERVVLALMEAFPQARLVTSVYDPETTFPEFAKYDVETTWLNNVPAFRRDPRRAMPLLPTVFAGVELDDVDVVVCSSSGWSHGVRSNAPKIVYCHNPARWLYQRHQYVAEHGLLVRTMVKALSPYLKWWDRKAAKSVDTYLANSRAVAGRIEREYGIKADILPPAITIDPEATQAPVEGLEPGFLLTVSRARGYKNTEVVCEGVEALPGERLVVVGGLPEGTWSDRLVGVKGVSDAQLRWLYANCSAVVAASHEDFGLTPVEGYTFGKPAVCLRAGGFLDTMDEGVSGVFIEDLSADAVRRAIVEFRELDLDNADILKHAAAFGFASFRDKLVREIEFALMSRGLDPVSPEPVPAVRAGRLPKQLLLRKSGSMADQNS